MFVVMSLLEIVTKYNATDSYLRQFKTIVPYAVVSWVSIQLTRIAHGLMSDSAAHVTSLYLSFVPFPMFCVFSRENHNYLPTMYLFITLTMHIRRIEPGFLKKRHYKVTMLAFSMMF